VRGTFVSFFVGYSIELARVRIVVLPGYSAKGRFILLD
jgi:hypothetical protein